MVLNHLHAQDQKSVLCTKQAFYLTTFNCLSHFLIHQQFIKYLDYYYEYYTWFSIWETGSAN